MLRCCVLFGVLTLANVAAAIPVTWEAHGVVRSVALGANADSSTAGALTTLGVEEGAPFSVSVGFDSDATLYFSATGYYDPYTGYAVGITDMHLDFSAWSLNGAVGPALGAGVAVVNQSTDPEGLGNQIRSSVAFAGDFADPTHSFPESPSPNVVMQWGFISNDPYFFSLDSLPTDPPDLTALPPWHLDPSDLGSTRGAVLYFTNSLDYKVFDVAAEITSVTRVPEPGVLALIALALFAVRYPRAR